MLDLSLYGPHENFHSTHLQTLPYTLGCAHQCWHPHCRLLVAHLWAWEAQL